MQLKEILILSSLVFNEEYSRKVLPYLKEEYFDQTCQKIVLRIIASYVAKYNRPPLFPVLFVELQNLQDLNEFDFSETSALIKILTPLSKSDPDKSIPWLVDQTEKFCQEKALYNGMTTSLLIMQDKEKGLEKTAIPQILTDALSITFDLNLGHDYIRDAEQQYEYYQRKEAHIPFHLESLNKITNGGLLRKTLNVIQGGCVHPDTRVRIKINEEIVVVPIIAIKKFLEEGKEVWVRSPDGWVRVTEFVEKGLWDEYILQVEPNFSVRVNEEHLFKSTMGWLSAKDLFLMSEVGKCPHIMTVKGLKPAECLKGDRKIPIVDIQVDHLNHRYWTEGVESHNTGTGKTTLMCDLAANHYYMGQNVLFISIEMSEEEIRRKIDANLMDSPIDGLIDFPKDMFLNKIEGIKNKTVGKLIIKEYPEASVGAHHFRFLLSELKLKYSFVPTVVYIDYLNLCTSSRLKWGSNVNTYSYMKAIAEELRGLAKEFNLPVITATQLNREGYGSSDPGLDKTSDSFGIPMTSDLQFVLIRNEELDSLGQLLFKQLKNRYNDESIMRRFIVGVDRTKGKFYEVDNPARGLIEENEESPNPMKSFGKSSSNKWNGFN